MDFSVAKSTEPLLPAQDEKPKEFQRRRAQHMSVKPSLRILCIDRNNVFDHLTKVPQLMDVSGWIKSKKDSEKRTDQQNTFGEHELWKCRFGASISPHIDHSTLDDKKAFALHLV